MKKCQPSFTITITSHSQPFTICKYDSLRCKLKLLAGSQTDIFVHHELVEITDRENCVNSKLCKEERVGSSGPGSGFGS